jgi:hypothetical protein
MARGQLGGYLDSAVEEMAHVLGQAGSQELVRVRARVPQSSC